MWITGQGNAFATGNLDVKILIAYSSRRIRRTLRSAACPMFRSKTFQMA
jgi:hypothetical protein